MPKSKPKTKSSAKNFLLRRPTRLNKSQLLPLSIIVLVLAALGTYLLLGIHAAGIPPCEAMDPAYCNATTLTLSDANNGQTVAASVGQKIQIKLSTTSWKFQNSSNSKVVRKLTNATYQATKPCIPGGACGTSTIMFKAVGVGTASLLATRSNCGEAMPCVPQNSAYAVTISVSDSGIAGLVYYSSGCGNIPAVGACTNAITLYRASIQIKTQNGSRVITTVRSDGNGAFKISLPPGNYVLVPLSQNNGHAIGNPQDVTVTSGYLNVVITYSPYPPVS